MKLTTLTVVLTAALALGGAPALAAAGPFAAANPLAGGGRFTAAVAEDTPQSQLLLMLDSSGSMNGPDPSGLTKLDAAKQALTAVVNGLPPTAKVGLRVYGATDPDPKITPKSCADTQLVAPIATLDKTALTAAIAGFTAKGQTPIAHSLSEGIKDLGSTGKRTIVLVSDGQETCVPDPCPVIRQLVGQGIDLQIDTVGFGVNAVARSQLQCIADAGHGTYYDAADAATLTTSLTKLSTRATRDFTVSGTRVTGTSTEVGAPALTAGSYVDTFTTGAGRKNYTLTRTIPRSTLHVALASRPPVDLTDTGYNTETFRFYVKDAKGADCLASTGLANRIGMSTLYSIVSARTVIPRLSDVTTCRDESTLTLQITRDEGNATPADVEILVMEEPPVTSTAGLPAVADKPDPGPMVDRPRFTGTATPVVGGVTFSDAPRLTPGIFTEAYLPGEAIFYRVHVDWGQQLAVTINPPTFATAYADKLGSLYGATIYSPDRGRVSVEPQAMGSLGKGSGATSDTTTWPTYRQTPQVRYLNRDSFGIDEASLAGDYYLAIAMPKNNTGVVTPIQVTFKVDVLGSATGKPGYAVPASPAASSPAASAAPASEPAAAPSASAATSAPADAGGPPWALIGGGLALLVALGAGFTAYARKR